MADEKIQIYKVGIDAKESIETVKDLKNNIKLLKERLSEATIGSDEYKATLDELKINQAALKDSMYATTASLGEISAAATGTGQSYNALVHLMASLKEELRATDVSLEGGQEKFDELAARIRNVNDKLKEMDAAQGNFQRNVGNYEGSLKKWSDGFSKTAGAAGSVINPVKNLTLGFKALSATPVIGILGLLANLLVKVTGNLNSSEENANKMTKAMGVFGGVADTVTKILQGLGSAVAWVTEKMASLYVSIFGETEAMKSRNKIAEESIALAKQERENTVANADAERQIAELREKSTDREKYTAEQRLEFVKKAGELENDIAKRAKEDLEAQYKIIKAKNALTESSADDLQKEADAYAAMVKAETDYLNKVASNNRALNTLRKEQKREAKEAAREANDALKSRIAAEKDLLAQQIELEEDGSAEKLRLQKERREKEYTLAVAEAKTKIKDSSTLNATLLTLEKKYIKDLELLERNYQKSRETQSNLHLQNLADMYESGTRDYLTAIRNLRKQELEQIQQEEGESDEEFNARKLAAQKKYYDSVRALNDKSIQESTAELRLALAKQEKGSEGYYAGMMQLAENYWKTLTKNAGESDDEFAIRQAMAFKAYQDSVNDYINYGVEQERLGLENRMNELEEGSVAYLERTLELKRFELDSIHQLEGESNEEFRQRQLEAEKAYNDAQKDLADGRIAVMERVADTTFSIMNSISDIFEANGDVSEKMAKQMKILKIAEATVETIKGAIAAYMNSVAYYKNPAKGIAMGVINAATVTAAGLANIAKIKNTNVSRNSASTASVSATPAVVDAPVQETQVQNVRSVTTSTEEERLNQMASEQRVVLVMSDLEVKQNQLKVQTEESSF